MLRGVTTPPSTPTAGPAVAPPASGPIFIVLNAGSGRGNSGATSATIAGVLDAAGREHHLLVVEDPLRLQATAEHAVSLARAACGVVVAAGGDGTLNTVAQAVLGSGCAFGVLPQGTFNYFGRAHGIPADTAEATRLLLTARAQPVQVGLINDRIFLVNASLGLYPQLLEDREAWKRRLGRSRLVAFGAALATLLRAHRRLRLRIEHGGRARDVRTPTLFVGNNRLQMEQIGTAQAFDEGRLAGIMLRPVGALGMLWLVLRGALARLGDADRVAAFGFDSLSVAEPRLRTRRRFKVATDGEVVRLSPPLVFRVSPEPLWLLAPDPVPRTP
jgi:diacylglycerol kinase family enzyme